MPLATSAAPYPGLAGLWPLPAAPGASQHAALVLGFVGDSRALAPGGGPGGGDLWDATDALGLADGEPTLACGAVGDRLGAQARGFQTPAAGLLA